MDFFMVQRIYLNPGKNNSMEIFKVEDYPTVDACLMAAEARFHNIITADLQNPDVIYQMTFIMDNGGNYVEKPVIFDRRSLPAAAE